MTEDTGADSDADRDAHREEPVVACDFQNGSLSVHDDGIVIDRSSNSMFDEKFVPMEEVRDVTYSGGFLSGHIQIEQDGVDPDEGGLLSHPVDENTLHFPRTKRPEAKEAHDAILERI